MTSESDHLGFSAKLGSVLKAGLSMIAAMSASTYASADEGGVCVQRKAGQVLGLKPTPAADIVDEHRFEISSARLNVVDQLFEPVATLDP